MISPIAMMIPPPLPQMSMAALRAEFRRVLDLPATPTPTQAAKEQASHLVDLKA
jgi:hypothetical protein